MEDITNQSLIKLDEKSNEPKYLQLVENIKYNIMARKMHAHEKLPSVRSLARGLCINPNTVQRAYSQLLNEKLIYSLPGKGAYVTDDTNAVRKLKLERIEGMIKEATIEARNYGLWIDDIFRLVDEAYSSNL